MVLEVDAFRCGVGGEQDTDRRDRRVGLERRLDSFAGVRVHPTVERQQSIASCKPFGREQALEPVLSRAVLGENDHSPVRPLPAGLDRRLEPANELYRLGIGPAHCRGNPFAQPPQQISLLRGRLGEDARRDFDRLDGGFFESLIVGVLLVDLVHEAAQHTDGGRLD